MERTLESLLAGVPVFRGLGPEQIAQLTGCAQNVRFAEGDTLFREGSAADTFFVVRQGSVSLETFVPGRGPVLIETLESGEVIGWSWLFKPYRWHFDARARSLVRATAFDGACLRAKCDADTALGYELMGRFAQVMIDRLQQTRLRLLDVYGNRGRL